MPPVLPIKPPEVLLAPFEPSVYPRWKKEFSLRTPQLASTPPKAGGSINPTPRITQATHQEEIILSVSQSSLWGGRLVLLPVAPIDHAPTRSPGKPDILGEPDAELAQQ